MCDSAVCTKAVRDSGPMSDSREAVGVLVSGETRDETFWRARDFLITTLAGSNKQHAMVDCGNGEVRPVWQVLLPKNGVNAFIVENVKAWLDGSNQFTVNPGKNGWLKVRLTSSLRATASNGVHQG